MATQTAGAESDKGRKYELSVAALLAFLLSENQNVENYHISSNIEQYYPFDDVVADVHFKGSNESQTYAIQTKCGKNDKFKIEKYVKGYDKVLKEGSRQFQQNIREDRIQFWYFTPNDISNFNKNSNVGVVPRIQNSTGGYKDILNSTNCCKLDCDEYKNFLKSFYLFLNQPTTQKIIEEIKNKRKIEDPWQIILYFDKQFVKGGEGVNRASFEHELLKVHLSNCIVTPTEATLLQHQAVHDWNRLTLEHNVTIVRKELNIKQHLYGCILQTISNIININKWNDVVNNGGKLDEEVIAQLKERSIKAETLKDFMIEMWVKNKVPLFLQTDAPLPILEEFRHLNKNYIIIDSNPEKRSTEFQSYNLSVFRRLYDVRDDNIIKNIVVSLQGRQQASLDEIIDEDKELMKAITCLDIINLIKPREVFLKEECLDGNNYMMFLIETTDPQENNYNTLRPTSDNISIYCRLGESLEDYERFRGDSRFRSYKIFRLRTTEDNKLILLFGIQEPGTVGGDEEKCGLECFFVDQNGESVYTLKNNDPIPIIGHIPIYVSGRLLPRYLSSDENKKRFAEQEFFKESKSPITIITGEPGIGKTTLLYSLFRFCEAKYYILFANLATYQSDLFRRNTRLFQNPLQFLYDKQGTLPYKHFLSSLRNYPNRFMLILDSFDEVVATCEKQVLELLEKLQEAGLQKILIASRLTDVGLLREKFKEAETFKIENFGEELEQHIGNWNLNIKDLDKIPSEFLHNPLYLGMLRTLSDDGRNLAVTNTWDLFEDIVNLKMENYCRRIEPYCLDENEKQDILSRHWQLALQAVTGTNEVTQKLTRSSHRNFARIGFIIYYDDENPIFVHRTLAEFFVGQWLIKNIGQDDAKFIYKLLLDRRDIRILDIISERLRLHKLMLRDGITVRDVACIVDESNILETDALGRNILHLVVPRNRFDMVLGCNTWITLNFLIYYMRRKKYDIYMRDSIMKWTWVDYLEYYGLEENFLSIYMWPNNFDALREAYVNYYANRIEKQFPLSRNFKELHGNALCYSSINMIQDLLFLKHHQDEAFLEFRRMCLNSYTRTDQRLLKFHLPEEKLTGAHLACIYSNTEALKIYIENQTNLNQTDIFNCTPLHYGVIAGQSDEIVKLLLEHCKTSNLEVGQFTRWTTILHMSVRTGNVNVTKMILEQCGDSQDSWDSDNCTPLEVALKSNLTNNYGGYDSTHLDVLKVLLEKGNVDKNIARFLKFVIADGNMKVAEILLSHGVGATSGLFYAIVGNHEDFVEFFLKNGANPNRVFFKKPFLTWAIEEKNWKGKLNLKIIDLLLRYGADVHKTDRKGYSSLDYIALYDSAEDVVQKLLNHNTCDVNLISQRHLHEAIKHGRSKIVELFLKKGARVDCAYGWVPLKYAVKQEENAEISYVDRFGFTPLITAVETGNIDIVKLLLLNGADVDFRNECGVTALYVAAFKRNLAMTKLLLEKGADVNNVILGDQILYNAKRVRKIEAVVLLLGNRTISQPPDTASNYSESDLAVNNIIEKVRRNWAGVNLEFELRSAVQEGFVNVHTIKLLKKWGNKRTHGEYWAAVFCLCEEMYYGYYFLDDLKYHQLNNLIAYICNTPNLNKNLRIIKALSRYHGTGFKIFEEATASNNWEVLQIALQNCNDYVLSKYESHDICDAVSKQDESLIEFLFKSGYKVNPKDYYTPLVLAAGLENLAIAEMLLKNGDDANLSGTFGVLPLHVAAFLENRDMVNLLLRHGAKPSIPTMEYSELFSKVKLILTRTKSSLVANERMNSDRLRQIIKEVARDIPSTSRNGIRDDFSP